MVSLRFLFHVTDEPCSTLNKEEHPHFTSLIYGS